MDDQTAQDYGIPTVSDFETSPQLNELFAALAKAQGEMDSAKKSSDNPFFKSKYADLAEVWEAIRGPLSKNGLCLTQYPLGPEGVISILGHSSGQFIRSVIHLPADKKGQMDAQTIGSMITYARRYSASAIAGIAQDDDDGNAASGKPSPARQLPAPRVANPAPVAAVETPEPPEAPDTPDQAERKRLRAIVVKTIGNTNLMKFWLGYFGKNQQSELPTDVAVYLPGYRYLVEQADHVKKELAEKVPADKLGAEVAKLQEDLK
jgi:hypothetical protein